MHVLCGIVPKVLEIVLELCIMCDLQSTEFCILRVFNEMKSCGIRTCGWQCSSSHDAQHSICYIQNKHEATPCCPARALAHRLLSRLVHCRLSCDAMAWACSMPKQRRQHVFCWHHKSCCRYMMLTPVVLSCVLQWQLIRTGCIMGRCCPISLQLATHSINIHGHVNAEHP